MSRENPNYILNCPAPYTLDPTLGLCIEPTPPGFSYVNGRFVRNCPPGMTMNDAGVCIRPVVTRKSFISDTAFQNTVLAIGAAKNGTEDSAVVYGSFDKTSLDIAFTSSNKLSGHLNQVSLIDGSTNVFLVATDQRGTQLDIEATNASPLYGMSVLDARGNGPEVTQYETDDQTWVPQNNVSVFEFNDKNNTMYMLGAPRNTIFQSKFDAASFVDWPKSRDPRFYFQEPSYSLQGETFPYFVGAYGRYALTNDEQLTTTTIGAVQTKFDTNQNVGEPNEPVQTTIVGDQNPCGPLNNKAFNEGRPLDPVPQILSSVSDLSSRAFSKQVLQKSKGFVLAGRNYADQFEEGSFGGGVAVRYLTDKPSGNQRPPIESLYSLDLSLAPNEGQIRLARFDVSESPQGPDVLYVFGSIVSDQSSSQNGTVLSFVSENHVYGGMNAIPFQFSFNNSTVTTRNAQITSTKKQLAFNDFCAQLQTICSGIVNGTTVQFDETHFLSTLKFRAIVTVPESLTLGQSFLQLTSTQTIFADYFGFQTNTQYFFDKQNDGSYFLDAPLEGHNEVINAIAAYNGLSWDDRAEKYKDGIYAVDLRPIVKCMPILTSSTEANEFSGAGLSCWTFDPVSGCLGFTVVKDVVPTQSQQNFSRQVYAYDHTGLPQTFTVPDNCVDLEVHMWGAGGSSDLQGTGGAGAFVSGHIRPTEWTSGSMMEILVGSGGQGTVGSGGSGNRSNRGRGGGRSAIRLQGRDLVTAGGGGGSTGSGQGGAASGAPDAVAESGLPSVNGGQGASTKGPGTGGSIYGDATYRKASSGAFHAGGPSTSTIAKTVLGGAGGGSGYFGGGAAGYLGTTNHPNDLHTGGGGGSSFTDLMHTVRAISGARNKAPYTQSTFYQEGIAEGGSAANEGLGGPGRVVIVATVRNGPNDNLAYTPYDSNGLSQRIFVSAPGAFSTMTNAEYGSTPNTFGGGAYADWSSKFFTIDLEPGNGFGRVVAIFVGLSDVEGTEAFVTCITESPSGSIYNENNGNPFTYVFKGFINFSNNRYTGRVTLKNVSEANSPGSTVPFGPITYVSGDNNALSVKNGLITLEPIKNVMSIRPLDALSPNRDLVFMGQGIRVIKAPAETASNFTDGRFVMNKEFNLPMDLTSRIVDGEFDQSNNTMELIATPNNMSVDTLLQSPWCPQFASFYNPLDIAQSVVPYLPWTQNNQTLTTLGPVTTLLGPFQRVTSGLKVPNTIILIRQNLGNWIALNVYGSTYASNIYETSPTQLRTAVQVALQAYMISLYGSVNTPTVAVILTNAETLSITITGLPSQDDFELAFTLTDIPNFSFQDTNWNLVFTSAVPEQEVTNALSQAGTLLGFQGLIDGTAIQTPNVGTYQVSFKGTSHIALVPVDSLNTTGALTPLSVPLFFNTVYEGSVFQVYAPTTKLSVLETSTAFPNGLTVAVGGPIASIVDTLALSKDPTILGDPVAFAGAPIYIDYYSQNDVTYAWTILNKNNEPINTETIETLPYAFRSPANILTSIDGGFSYTYVQSLLGSYLIDINSSKFISSYAFTGLDAFHLTQGQSSNEYVAVGPARFRSPEFPDGLLNAAVSQFNDIQWFPNDEPNSKERFPGFFMAVGNFLWELNALVSPNVTWPNTVKDLNGVAWVSVDGLVWTTIRMNQDSATPTTLIDNFYLVNSVDYINPEDRIATIATDIGLYRFNVDVVQTIVFRIFGYIPAIPTQSNGPVLDFSETSPVQIQLQPIGRTGPFAAVCIERDTIGSCVSCNDKAQTEILARITGVGGEPRENVSVCLRSAGFNVQGYSSNEASLDAEAISAYSGFDGIQNGSNYVKGLRQSFLFNDAETLTSSILLCPERTDPSSTPASVDGPGAYVSSLMPCTISASMNRVNTNVNAGGQFVVRRPAIYSGSTPFGPDPYYAGGSLYENTKNAWQPRYAYESRHMTLVPLDSFTLEEPNTIDYPFTVGLGGSLVDFNNKSSRLGNLDAYPVQNELVYDLQNGVSKRVMALITNLQANEPGPGLSKLSGPTFTNQSLGTLGANWNPRTGIQNRAVLANYEDTLPLFQYAQIQEGPSGSQGLQYNPFDVQSETAYQSRNPYVYKLSTLPFPYDSVSQDIDVQTFQLSIGRDPQVYEPGFGPLQYYALNNVGFAASKYNRGSLPWGANPLPLEGYASWFIQQLGDSIQSDGITYPTGLYQVQVGYGTLPLVQDVEAYSGAYAPYSKFLDLKTDRSRVFAYDTQVAAPERSTLYLDWPGGSSVKPTEVPKYSQNTVNWTAYLPYNGPSKREQPFTPVASVTEPNGNLRRLYSKYSIQNMLALRLKNTPSQREFGPTYNFVNLVTINFFRPRNWAFRGLLVNLDGNAKQVLINNAVPQLILATDQPNGLGQYEFLVPDPYFAKSATEASICGFVPNASDRAVLQAALGTFPNTLDVLFTSADIATNILTKHVAFHYFTVDWNSQNARLDIYVNVSEWITNFNRYRPLSKVAPFDWTKLSLPNGSFNLNSVLAAYVVANTNQPVVASALMNTLGQFSENILNQFCWTDPATQTVRSLQSMQNQGLSMNVTLQGKPLLVVPLTKEASRTYLEHNRAFSANDLDTANKASLLHFQVLVNIPSQGTFAKTSQMFASNLNALSVFGYDTSTTTETIGFVPKQDPRSRNPMFAIKTNFSGTASTINALQSDYNVEANNALLYASGGSPIRQDLLAQDPAGPQTSGVFGNPIWGFGLRIDSDALKPEVRQSQLATRADIPTDHGYVSMVRTIIDGQGRYTKNAATRLDESPHVARLTYVTKYVPSKLQAYGAIIPFAPMRIPDAWTNPDTSVIQGILNPFRPRLSYLIQDVQYGVPWYRSLAVSETSSVGNWATVCPNVIWNAWNSKFFDLEAPGFYGRCAMPVPSQFFDSSGNLVLENGTANVFANNASLPLAGYEGVVNESMAHISGNVGARPITSFRSGLTLAQYLSGCKQFGASTVQYRNYLNSLDNTSLVLGQMLVNVRDMNREPFNTKYVRVELGVQIQAVTNSQYLRMAIRMDSFFTTYVLPAYASLFGSAMNATYALVTASEIAAIVSSALQSYMNAFLTTRPDGLSPALNPYFSVQMTPQFNAIQDRCTFTITATPVGGNKVNVLFFRLVLPDPVNEWLGLRPVVAPMFDTGAIPLARTTTPESQCYQPNQRPGTVGDNACYGLTFGQYFFSDSGISKFGKFQASKYLPAYLYPNWEGGFPNNQPPNTYGLAYWSDSAWISPLEFMSEYQKLQDDVREGFIQSGTNNQTITENRGCFWDGFKGTYSYHLPQGFYNKAQEVKRGAPAEMNQWLGFATKGDTKVLDPNFEIILSSVASATTSQTNRTESRTFNLEINPYPYTTAISSWDYSQKGWVWSQENPLYKAWRTQETGWTDKGWSNGTTRPSPGSPPLYSLYFEGSNAIDYNNASTLVTSITFSGRSGMNSSTGAIQQSNRLALCDITNVSWTTRLLSDTVPYYYGFVQSAGFVQEYTKLPLDNRFSCYQADAQLTNTTYSGTQLASIYQEAPTPSYFMTGTISQDPNNVLTTAFATNQPSSPWIDAIALPALEVPCSYGFSGGGTDSQGQIVSLTKPVNYNIKNYSISEGSEITTSPSSAKLASIGSIIDTSQNWAYSTRITYNVFQSNGSGSFEAPYALESKLGTTTATANQLVPESPTNNWSGMTPPLPATTSGASGIGAGTITNACGMSIYLVTEPCVFNLGPTSGSSKDAPSNTNVYTQYALYAFNYKDLFKASQEPYQDLKDNYNNNVVDTSKLMYTYLQGIPYYMDENYDTTKFSTLGRSFVVDSRNKSSFVTNQKTMERNVLEPKATEPVILIVAPMNQQRLFISRTTDEVTDLRDTYSNGLVYSFTNRYNTLQTYRVAFSSISVGPAWTFYGLENNDDVSKVKSDAKADNSGKTVSGATTTRKAYYDLSSGTESTVLGLDIRQVYPNTSFCITTEPSASAFTYDMPSQPNVEFGFHVATPEEPSWSQAIDNGAQLSPYLPLAGVWTTDLNTDLQWSETQYVPNYEGLSIVALWDPSLTQPTSYPQVSAAGVPNFKPVLVDRNPGANTDLLPTVMPFTLNNYDTYRPSSLFVLACDIWRNTLRSSQAANFKATKPDLKVPGAIKDKIQYIDCLGQNDYSKEDIETADYYSTCAIPNNSLVPYSSGNPFSWTTTLWSQNGRLWNPFTGGGFWNDYKQPSLDAINLDGTDQDLNTNFGPTLWWPTYRWKVSSQNVGNTSVTSVATNPTLLKSNLALFTCTDGTIRKVQLGAPFRAIDSTGFSNFLNNSVNASPPVYGYITPGRLYNLTWWSDNWWCTADSNSVWTTAPLDTIPPIPINDQQTVVDSFFPSAVLFRPLSISEGSPEAWNQANYSKNDVHPFNLMKVLTIGNNSVLFIGNTDGTFLILQKEGSRYQAYTTNKLTGTQFNPSPPSTNASKYAQNVLYLTDIDVFNDTIVAASSVVPINPSLRPNDDIPWWDPVTNASLWLTRLGLTFTEPQALAVPLLLSSDPTEWFQKLLSSIVVRAQTQLEGPNLDIYEPFTIESRMQDYVTNLSTDLLGDSGTEISFEIDPITKQVRSVTLPRANNWRSGVLSIQKPAYATLLQSGSLDWPSYPYFYVSPQGNEQLFKSLTIENVNVGYGIQNDANNTVNSALASVLFALQIRSQLLEGRTFSTSSTSTLVPTFYEGGFLFDSVAKNFFVIKEDLLGLKTFSPGAKEKLKYQPQTGAGVPGIVFTNKTYEDVIVNTISGVVNPVSPAWQNTQGYTMSVKAEPNGNGGYFYEAVPVSQPVGRAQSLANLVPEEELLGFNTFLTMIMLRTAPILSSFVVSDMALGIQVQAIAWTAYGPYGLQGVSVATVPSSGSLVPSPVLPQWEPFQPLMTGPSIVAWNPYELKFYVAGTGTNLPDWAIASQGAPGYSASTQLLLRPDYVPEQQWAVCAWDLETQGVPRTGNQSRLMLLSGNCAAGALVQTADGSSYATKFTQVFDVIERSSQGPRVGLVSHNFTTIRCFGFSPGATAIGGSSAGPNGDMATLMWRTNIAPASNDLNANWSRYDLGVPGYISAMKFVGYAWYIAVWKPGNGTVGTSSLFFASINFSVVTLLDTWNTSSGIENNQYQITSIDATLTPSGVCGPGYEPDPSNPNVCIKTCPDGYSPFGSLCVQTCPGPFKETGVPNECVPDFIKAKTVSPMPNGQTPTVVLKEQFGPVSGIPGEGFNVSLAVVYGVLILLGVLLLGGIIRALVKRAR